jgi:hypothetical protein
MEFLAMLAAVVTLAVPGRTNANASMASDGARVAVVWAATAPGGSTDVYLATSQDGARTFGAPVRVNDVEGEARVSGEQPPRVAMRGAEIAVSWVSKREGTTIRFARSMDGGRTFGASQAASKPGAPGNRGWHTMTIDRRGDVEIAWLDHRDMAGPDGAHQMDASAHGTADGAVMAQRSGFYVAHVRAGAGAVPAEQRVTTGVCYCCKTAIAAASDGAIVAAWRHVYPGNIRDITFSRAADGRAFSAPVRVSSDKWQLDGCPDDGPAIALDAANVTHIVWPTMTKNSADGAPTLAIFYATSRDGSSFTPRAPLPTSGVAHHPQIAIERDGSIAVTWDEVRDGARHVAVARGRADAAGHVSFTRVPLEEDQGVYPVVATTADAIAVALTVTTGESSTIQVQRMSR